MYALFLQYLNHYAIAKWINPNFTNNCIWIQNIENELLTLRMKIYDLFIDCLLHVAISRAYFSYPVSLIRRMHAGLSERKTNPINLEKRLLNFLHAINSAFLQSAQLE